MTTALVLMLALPLDAALPDQLWLFRRLPHPVAIAGAMIAWLDRRLNRSNRGETARRWRGGLAVAVMIGLALGAGATFSYAARRLPYGWALELALVVILIAQRSLFDHVAAVRRALSHDGLPAGRQAVARIVGRDTETLDSHEVVRAAIETCAENFSDAVVAPCLWYLACGLPGLFAYKTANTLDSMIGYRNDRYRAFGMVAARLDDLLNLVPARLSGLYLCVAALFLPGGRPAAALRTMVRDAPKHRSPNAGWPEAAMAGALGLALGGPRRYGALAVQGAWLGEGRARALPEDIRRALFLFALGCLINLLVIAALARL